MAFLQLLKTQVNNVNLSIGELEKDARYPVLTMKNVDTKFGRAIACVLEDPECGRKINVFLPKAIAMTDNMIEDYNNDKVSRIKLIFRGLNKRSFMIDFE